jgi:DNA-binding transcriptional MerR regulator
MVRKRHQYTRLRAKRSRPKTPAPKSGWLLAELSQLSQVPLRRLRYYLEHGLIRPIEFRGTATRYGRRELVRVLGIARLRAEKSANLAEIKREFEALGDRDLEVWLRAGSLPPAAAAALAATQPPSPRVPSAATSDLTPNLPNVRAELVQEASTWHQIHLLPGLALVIAADANSAALDAAHKIHATYGGAPR